MAERTPRDQETRAKMERPKKWMPSQLLPDVNQEEGYAYRWIRVSAQGQADASNVSGKFQEGWEPVKASEHPELHLHLDSDSASNKDTVVVGGLMLCKTPVEFVEQRNDYYAQQANDQMTAVDNSFLRQSDARMPLFSDKKSSTTFGSGK